MANERIETFCLGARLLLKTDRKKRLKLRNYYLKFRIKKTGIF
jgi:hypothetical protein